MFPERGEEPVRVVRTRWPSYQPMVLVVIAFALGVFLDRELDLNGCVAFVLAWTCLVAWCFCFRRQSNDGGLTESRVTGSRERIGSTILLVGLVFAGVFWHHGRWNWFGVGEIGRFASGTSIPCCVDATVISEPRWMLADERSNQDRPEDSARTRLTVRVNRIRDGEQWIDAGGIADLVIHTFTKHVKSGDQIHVFGRLVASSPPSNPGQFDFQAYFRAESKLAFLHVYQADSVQVMMRTLVVERRFLSSLRQRLNELTWTYVDHQEAGLASAILLGNREQLSRKRRDVFLETGTVHLLAISGLHVGILAGSFFLLFRIGLLSRRRCLWLTILFVVFYAWLVEFRPPVSRAAILVTLFCLGRLWGENHFSFNLLAIAGWVVLLINPSDLFGLGPQLSFLAVATLTFGREWVFWPPPIDPVKRLIASTRPWPVRCFNWMGRQLRTAILVSGLIWIVSMPLVAFRFHLIAPIALVVNPLLLIPIAWGLFGGLGVLVFGWFLPPAAYLSGWFCERNLALIEWIIGAAQAVPASHLWTAGPSGVALAVFYLGVFLFAVYPPSRLPGRWIAGLALGWLVFGWLVPSQVARYVDRHSDKPLICTFVDVGHGSCVLMQLPDGRNLLYDAGSLGAADYAARTIAGVLWSEQIERLDAVVLSHADVDHFNALSNLAHRFSIEVVYVTQQMEASDSPAVKELWVALEECGVSRELVAAGDELFVDSAVGMKLLGPPRNGIVGNDNANSLVLLLEHLGRKVLLPGDLERAGLDRLLDSNPIDTDVVMAAHHGSQNSQPEAFMRWATPEYVVISGGSQRVTDRVIRKFEPTRREVARTDVDGAIRFSVDRRGVRFERWESEPWR